MSIKTGNLWKKAAGCALALTMMSACSSASAASSSSTITAESADISTKYAEVQSVDGSSVTVAYGTIQEKSTDGQNGGAAPSSAPDASAMPEGSAAPDMTSGATSSADSTTGATAGGNQAPDGKGQQGQAPDGSAPQGGTPSESAMPSMSAADLLGFTASGDTTTITLDSDVTIIKNSQTVSVSDMAAGDILMITCTGDKVTAIEIMSAEMPQSGQPGAQASDAPTASTSTNA
jgi:hypothetical protein